MLIVDIQTWIKKLHFLDSIKETVLTDRQSVPMWIYYTVISIK